LRKKLAALFFHFVYQEKRKDRARGKQKKETFFMPFSRFKPFLGPFLASKKPRFF